MPNPSATSASAIAANSANLSQLYSLFGGVNTFNAGQAHNQLALNMPNYNALTQQQSGLIGEELAGQLPQDVVDQILQRAAERGITTGNPGGPASNSSYLKALGLNSLDLTTKGLAHLSTAIHDTPTAPLANPASMFITPDQVQEAQMAANLYASAPNPAAAANAARSAAGTVKPGGGYSSGVRVPNFGGGYSTPPASTSPSYQTLFGNATGSPQGNQNPTASDYANWSSWYGSLNNPNSYGGGGSQPGVWQDTSQPDFWGAPGGTTYNTIDNSYQAPGGNPGGYSGWGAFNDDEGYNPLFDASFNPNPGGSDNYYDFSNVDFGF